MSTTVRIKSGDSIDHHLKNNRRPGTVFQLEPGIFHTLGAFSFEGFDLCMLAPGCSIVGSGAGQSIVYLGADADVMNGPAPTKYVQALTGGARTTGYSGNLRFHGFTLQIETAFPVVALQAWSNQTTVTDVDVRGVAGYRQHDGPVKEGFGILINNPATEGFDPDGGSRVEHCSVSMKTMGQENYSTGIYIGHVKRGQIMAQSFMKKVSVFSKDGHCGIAFNDHVQVEEAAVYGVRRAIFMDTGPVRLSSVSKMVAVDVCWALESRVSTVQDERYGILIQDSRFAFRTHGAWAQAVLLSDDRDISKEPKQPRIDPVEFERCYFIAPTNGKASKGRQHGVAATPYMQGCRWIGDWEVVQYQSKS